MGLCVLGSAAALATVGRTWATGAVAAVPPLPAQDLAVTGADVGSPVRGLAVVGLAGAVAVLAARGWGRTAVGLLVALAGLGIAVAGLGFDAGAALDADGRMVEAARTAWPLAAAASGAVLAAAGGLVAARGRRWAAMSQRYDSPSAPRPAVPAAAAGERQLWEALDRGEDPTAADLPAPPGDDALPPVGPAPGLPPTAGPDRPAG